MIRRLAAVAAGALAATALVVPTGSASAPDRAPGIAPPDAVQMVALGDSFAAGPGILPYVSGSPANCGRSSRNYASLYAERAAIALDDRSCGGAQTKHFTESQGGNPAQFEGLTADTDLVSFGTMGGNDIGLVGLAMGCVTGDCVPAAGTDPLAAKFTQLEADLTADLADAKTRAPNARFLVIGYGTYVPPTGCNGALPGFTAAEETYLQSQIDRLSDLLKSMSEGEATFIDMRTIPGVLDHTACAPPEKQWIRALNPYNDGAQLHPSYCGMDAWAQHINRTLQALADEPVTPFDSSCVSAGGPTETPAPTVTASPTPTVQPVVDGVVQRMAALREAATTVTLRTSCRPRTVKFRAAGGSGFAAKARFKVGAKVVGKDVKAPFALTRAVRRLPHRGKVGVRVWLRDGELTVTRSLKVERPRCMR